MVVIMVMVMVMMVVVVMVMMMMRVVVMIVVVRVVVAAAMGHSSSRLILTCEPNQPSTTRPHSQLKAPNALSRGIINISVLAHNTNVLPWGWGCR